MLIQITNRCHMGCKHCMQDASPKGKHMTDETFGQVMDFCMEAGPVVVNVVVSTKKEADEAFERIKKNYLSKH